MMIKIVIPPFHAAVDRSAIHGFLRSVGEGVKNKMVQEAAAGKSGRVYQLSGGGSYTASAPGEFPANKHGHLSASYSVEVDAMEMEVGTDVAVYPAYLRTGTHKMAPRKFLREALEFAMAKDHMTRPFAVWRHG